MDKEKTVGNIQCCLRGNCGQCDYCCANWHNARGVNALLTDALAVIEKQSKQIESLQKKYDKEKKE